MTSRKQVLSIIILLIFILAVVTFSVSLNNSPTNEDSNKNITYKSLEESLSNFRSYKITVSRKGVTNSNVVYEDRKIYKYNREAGRVLVRDVEDNISIYSNKSGAYRKENSNSKYNYSANNSNIVLHTYPLPILRNTSDILKFGGLSKTFKSFGTIPKKSQYLYSKSIRKSSNLTMISNGIGSTEIYMKIQDASINITMEDNKFKKIEVVASGVTSQKSEYVPFSQTKLTYYYNITFSGFNKTEIEKPNWIEEAINYSLYNDKIPRGNVSIRVKDNNTTIKINSVDNTENVIAIVSGVKYNVGNKAGDSLTIDNTSENDIQVIIYNEFMSRTIKNIPSKNE